MHTIPLTRPSPLAPLLGLVLLCGANWAYAQEPCSPDAVQKLLDATRGGAPENALADLGKAAEACPAAATIPLAAAALLTDQGNCPEATAQLDLAEQLAKTAGTIDQLTDEISAVRRGCAQSGTLAVHCVDEGVSVRIEGIQPAPCPYTGKLSAGEYTVVADKPGFEAFKVQVTVQEEGESRTTIPRLQPIPAGMGTLELSCSGVTHVQLGHRGDVQTVECPASLSLEAGSYSVSAPRHDVFEEVEIHDGQTSSLAVAPAPEPVVEPVADADDVPTDPQPDEETADNEGLGLSLWGWVGVGTGTAILATGIALHAVASSDVDDINADTSLTRVDAISRHDDAKSLNTGGAVAMILGTVVLAGGASVLVLDEMGMLDGWLVLDARPDQFAVGVAGRF